MPAGIDEQAEMQLPPCHAAANRLRGRGKPRCSRNVVALIGVAEQPRAQPAGTTLVERTFRGRRATRPGSRLNPSHTPSRHPGREQVQQLRWGADEAHHRSPRQRTTPARARRSRLRRAQDRHQVDQHPAPTPGPIAHPQRRRLLASTRPTAAAHRPPASRPGAHASSTGQSIATTGLPCTGRGTFSGPRTLKKPPGVFDRMHTRRVGEAPGGDVEQQSLVLPTVPELPHHVDQLARPLERRRLAAAPPRARTGRSAAPRPAARRSRRCGRSKDDPASQTPGPR